MPGCRTALGIDITEDWINLALLKKQGGNVKLLKAARAPVPEGAVLNGNIQNPSILTKAVTKLKSKNKIRIHPTAVSLPTKPMLMQVLEIPGDTRTQVRQFVYNEVKHYALLPIKKAAIDFCGIKSSTKSGSRRVFIAATDGQKISATARAFFKKGINIKVIEPALTAYTRAFNIETSAAQSTSNILYATVSNNVLTISVFVDQSLNFVRTKTVEPDPAKNNEYLEWLAEEISTVLKFHELKAVIKSKQWQVLIVADNLGQDIKRIEKQLNDKLNSVELRIRISEQAYLNTPVAQDVRECKPSAVAIGLAMGLLCPHPASVNINLLPQDVVLSKLREQKTLIIANVAAAVFVMMIICLAFYQAKAEKLSSQIRNRERIRTTYDTHALLEERAVLDKQLAEMTDKFEHVKNAAGTSRILKWGPILDEIGQITPRTVRINELSGNDISNIVLNGQAISYEAVNLFVESLNNCPSIDAASLVGSRSNRNSNNLIGYSIVCKLVR